MEPFDSVMGYQFNAHVAERLRRWLQPIKDASSTLAVCSICCCVTKDFFNPIGLREFDSHLEPNGKAPDSKKQLL